MLLSSMFSAWRTKSKEIWEAQLVVDHPAGDYSPNQYVTRDDVHTEPVTVHYLDHNLLHPRGHLGQLLGVHHRVTRFETHMD
jgi:hypothetical protein